MRVAHLFSHECFVSRSRFTCTLYCSDRYVFVLHDGFLLHNPCVFSCVNIYDTCSLSHLVLNRKGKHSYRAEKRKRSSFLLVLVRLMTSVPSAH